MNHEEFVPEFDINNPYLPILVCSAALDIENFVYGDKSNEDSSTAHLSKLLSKHAKGRIPLDSLAILSYAISGREGFDEFWKSKTLDQFYPLVNLKSEGLRSFRELSRRTNKEVLYFCLNLCREICDYQLMNGF